MPPGPPPPRRPLPARIARHVWRLYGRLGRLDRLGGGGLAFSTVVKVAAWAGLLAVLAVLVSRLRGIEAQLDPVAHGVEKLQRDVEAARGSLAEQSKRSRAELEELGERARTLRLTVERTADVEAKAGRDVGQVATDARALRDELQARLDEIRALEARQAEAVQKLSDLAEAADASQVAVRAAAQTDVASLQALNESMKGMEASAAALERGVAALPVGAAQAELAEVQANAGKLAQALSAARLKLAPAPTPATAAP
jgi:chromosome segregation ATPase